MDSYLLFKEFYWFCSEFSYLIIKLKNLQARKNLNIIKVHVPKQVVLSYRWDENHPVYLVSQPLISLNFSVGNDWTNLVYVGQP